MNQLVKIFGILFLTANFTQAQSSKFELGIEGGPTYSNLYGPEEKFKYRGVLLYSTGISFQYHFSNLISLKTGLSYDPKGYTGEYEITYTNSSNIFKYSLSQHFDYLTLPLMIRLQFGEKVHFFTNVGGYLGLLLSDNRRVERNGGSDPYYSYYSKFLKPRHSNLDFGVLAGLGIGVPIKNRWTISLEARGNLGLADVQSDYSGLFQRNKTATYSAGLLVGVSYWVNPSRVRDISGKRHAFEQQHRFEIGMESGPNNSPFLGNRDYHYSNSKGHTTIRPSSQYSAGISFQWNSNKHFSMRTGLIYQQHKYSFVNHNNTNSGSHSIEYLNLPAMARVTVGQKVHFFLNAGLFLGVAIRQIENVQEKIYSPTTTFIYRTSNKIPNFNPINFGLVGGLGIGVPIKKRIELSLEIRNSKGLTNSISKIPNTDNPQKLGINALNALLGISYKFGFRETDK